MKKRKSMILALIFMLGVVLANIAPSSAQSLENLEELEAFFDGILEVQLREPIASAAVAVVHNGEIIFAKGYGYADYEKKILVDPAETLFRGGSNSKLFVWTAIMQLYEQGLLDLNTDINYYLDFEIPGSPITLMHLMTHTAGFEDKVIGLFVLEPEEIQPLGKYLKENIPARFSEPGERMSYSNYATGLAAYIVERVSGQDFNTYVEENILAPLEMENTTFRQPVPASLQSQLAKGYAFVNGTFKPHAFEYIQLYPAGSISSSVVDMAKFMINQLQLGQSNATILSEETASLMQSEVFRPHQLVPGMAHGYAVNEVNGRKVLYHGGNLVLQHSGFYLLPEEQVGIYVVYSGDNAGVAHTALFSAFMDRFFPGEALEVKPSTSAKENPEDYQGFYLANRSNYSTPESILRIVQGTKVKIDSDGYLLFPVNGQIQQFGEVAPDVFYSFDGHTKLFLERDSSGKVVEIHLNFPVSFMRASWSEHPFAIGSIVVFSIVIALILIGRLVYVILKPDRFRVWGLELIFLFFASSIIGFLISLISLFANIDPVLGLPKVMFQAPTLVHGIYIFPVLIAFFLAALLGLTPIAWKNGLRLRYLVVIICGNALTWVLFNFNFIDIWLLVSAVAVGFTPFAFYSSQTRLRRNRYAFNR